MFPCFVTCKTFVTCLVFLSPRSPGALCPSVWQSVSIRPFVCPLPLTHTELTPRYSNLWILFLSFVSHSILHVNLHDRLSFVIAVILLCISCVLCHMTNVTRYLATCLSLSMYVSFNVWLCVCVCICVATATQLYMHSCCIVCCAKLLIQQMYIVICNQKTLKTDKKSTQ